MPLTELVYCSTIAPGTLLPEVFAIQKQAQTNNATRQISGLLVFNKRFFLQVLEGPSAEVQALYARIALDKRHRNVRTLGQASIESCHWANWSMGLMGLSPANSAIFEQFFGAEAFDPYELNHLQAQSLLRALTKIASPGP